MVKTTALPISIRLLSKNCSEEDIERASNAILSAFGYYDTPPETPSFLAGETIFSPELSRWQIQCAVVAGRVYVAESSSGEIVGTAVWFGPGEEVLKSYPSEKQYEYFNRFLAAIKTRCPRMPDWWNNSFLPRVDAFATEALGDPTAQLDSWYLHLLGVSRHYQGRGVGTELIQTVQEEASRRLDPRERRLTVMAGPVAFYRSTGFVLVHYTEIDSEPSLDLKEPFFYLIQDVLRAACQ